MRILIAGGGGLGTVLAGSLSRGGADVTLLVRPAQAAAFDGSRVRVTGAVEFEAPVQVASDPGALGRFDYAIVSVKGKDTGSVLAALTDVSIDAALSVQNGVRKDDLLVRTFGRGRVLGAVSAVAGTLLRPGVAFHPYAGPTQVGELDGTASVRGEVLASALRAGGLPAACVTEIGRREWYKLAAFLRSALVCALVRTDIASAIGDPNLAPLCAGVALAVAAVAEAEGRPVWQFSPAFPGLGVADPDPLRSPDRAWTEAEVLAGLQDVSREMAERGAVVYPSLAQDVMAGKPTELEFTAGDAVARAQRHGLRLETLETCARLLRRLERASS